MDIHVLVVDDDPQLRNTVCRALRLDDLAVTEACGAAEAMAFLQGREADLVISDIRMPEVSGVDLLRWIRKTGREVPVILTTAYTESQYAVDALNLGALYLLRKPFELEELERAVDAALAPARLRRAEQALRMEVERRNCMLRQQVVDAIAENQILFMATLKTLAHAIDARDAYTHQHSTAVARYAGRVARGAGLSHAEVDDAQVAGSLHDIGKIAVPEHILLKPTTLTEEEFAVIRDHPVRGAHILSPLPEMDTVRDAVRSHHERYDGKGYPDGLAGEAIPRLARILTVCDAWDAMTTKRPYRKALPREEAERILLAERERQFDPQMVEVFLECARAREGACADRTVSG